MKYLYKKIFGKKQGKQPLFQIRRHIFEYENGKRGRKNKRTLSRLKTQFLRLNINIKILRNILLGAMTTIVGISLLFLINLNVSAIDITRENSLINIDESYRALDYLRGRNILGIQQDTIIQRLQSTQSVVRDVHFQRNFPNQITLHIIPYEPIFQTEKGYIMDNGQLHTFTTRGFQDIPKLDLVGFEPSLLDRRPDFSLDDLMYIIKITRELENNIPGFIIAGKKYYVKERELHIIDNLGTLYLFDLTDSIVHQVEKLSIYFTEKGKNTDERELKYIDVRIPRGIFKCPMESARQCLINLENIYGSDVLLFSFTNNQEESEENSSIQEE